MRCAGAVWRLPPCNQHWRSNSSWKCSTASSGKVSSASLFTPGSAIGWRHSVDYHLFGTAGRRYDESPGTHAETVYSTAVHLCDETVFGSRQVFTSSAPVVVLYLVYQSCRMFQTHSDGYSFGFDSHIVGGQPAIYISCRMTCCQDDRGMFRPYSALFLSLHPVR